MHTKQLYCCNDQQLIDEQAAYLDALYEFNHTRPSERTKRNAMLSQMFAKIGKDCYIEPPMYANRGGKHVVAVGSPCHILRAIDKDDEVYYHKQYRVDIE